LTLPGMIEEPGSFSGMLSSANPARGPHDIRRTQRFLSHPRVPVPGCLILDVSLPGLNGLDSHKRVAVDHIDVPSSSLREMRTFRRQFRR
jgi:FixJ family two-component response regulator